MAANDWSIIHKEHDGTVITEFPPENLHFTLNKGENGPHTINYEVSRSRPVIGPDFVAGYRTDFELYNNADLILAGLHTPMEVNSDEEMASVSGKGWLHYLERRYWPYDSTDPNAHRVGVPTTTDDNPPEGYAYYISDEAGKEITEIIEDILDEVLAEPNSLPITHPLTAIGETIDYYTIDRIDTENIHSKITSLSQRDPGEFDFEVTNAKVFKIYAPRQYNLAVVDDENHADIEHIFDTETPASGIHSVSFGNVGPLATRLIGQGSSQGSNIVSVREYAAASTTFRLLEDHVSFNDVNDPDMVSRLTRKRMLFGVNPVHEIVLTVVTDVIANFWTRFKPGIAIWVNANLEAHNIDSAQEIVSMECAVDQGGGDTLVTFKLNQIYAAVGLS